MYKQRLGVSPSSSRRKAEKWSDVIQRLNLDLANDTVYYIKARQIKEITNEEPRLMVRMDRLEAVPRLFKDTNRFILSISRKEYALVRGLGFHKIERLPESPIVHHTRLRFPSSTFNTESESIFLDYANSCGLLQMITGQDSLALTFRGRTTTPSFSFHVNGSKINVNGAQIEVDAGYESFDEMLLFEAKIGTPDSFNIRQIYYPFRTFLGKNKITRNFFLCVEPKERTYSFWEYEFKPYDRLDSINFVHGMRVKISVTKMMTAKSFVAVNEDRNKINIPQADDVNKIIEFCLRVFEGYDTSEKMRKILGLIKRQSSYYRQASEIIGLVEMNDGNKYRLTDIGEKLVQLQGEAKASLVCKLLLQFPVINEIFIDISSNRTKEVTRKEISNRIRKNSYISGSTVYRRTQTIVSWFRWIRSNLGIVDVDKSGNIRISPQVL